MTRMHAFLAAAFLAAMPGAALAQVAAAKPEVPAPRGDPAIEAKPGNGVIRPANPDPGITVPPARGGAMAVVPPPGTPGGNPAVIPK